MAERGMKTKIGGFVAMSILGLTGLVILFGGAPTLFKARTNYVVLYPEAPGITPGTPVRKSGIRVGQVKSLDLDEKTGYVRVSVEIEDKYLPRQNEEAVISRGLLSGDTTIDFVPIMDRENKPIAKSDVYSANSEIMGVAPLNPRTLLNQASGAIPNAQEALNKFTITLGTFEKVAPKAEKALDEFAEFAKSAREVIPEIRETNRRLQNFIGPSDPVAPAKPELDGNTFILQPKAEDATNLRALVKEIQDFVKAYKPLADDIRGVVKTNEKDITAALKSIRDLTEKAGAFLTDDNRTAIAAILKSFQAASGDLLSEDNRKNVASILKNVKEGSEDLTKTIRLGAILVDRADTAMKELTTTVKEFNARSVQAKGVLENIDKATKPVADNAEAVMKNIATAADNLSKTIAEAKKTLALVNNSDGTINKVLNDPQLYNQLVESMASLNRTLMRTEKIAKDLEVFADKIARKPETIGLGGVVRPSTGLKEAPSAPIGPIPYPAPYPRMGNANGMRPIPPVPSGMEIIPVVPISPTPGAVEVIPPVSSFRRPAAVLEPARPLPDDLPR